jgi:uncharacterized membrane protein YedE/YeeE
MALVVAYVAGVLFAVGLALGGMTQPAKVLAFLDLAGAWDPSLAFVMAGAVAVHAAAYRFIVGRRTPLFADSFALPTRTDLEPRLVAGGVLFGVGWGLAGYCPGPALTAAASGSFTAIVVTAAMLLGMLLFAARDARTRGATATAPPGTLPGHDAPATR